MTKLEHFNINIVLFILYIILYNFLKYKRVKKKK